MNELMGSINNSIGQVSTYELFTNELTPITKINYISTIKKFFSVSDLSDITIEMIKNITPEYANVWASRQITNGKARSTVNRELSCMQSFYEFLCRRNVAIMSYNPFSTKEGCIRYKNATSEYSQKRTLTKEEVSMIVEAIGDDHTQLTVLRDKIIILLLATTGMRRAELCNLKVGDIHALNGVCVVELLGKGNKKRQAVVANSIVGLIGQYLNLRGVSLNSITYPLVVAHSNSNRNSNVKMDTTSIGRIVKRCAENAGLDSSTISAHTFRHTFAQTAYSQLGVNRDALQSLMGHSSLSTTQRYLKPVDTIENSPSEKLGELFGI